MRILMSIKKKTTRKKRSKYDPTEGTLIYCPYLNKLNFDSLLFAHKHNFCYSEHFSLPQWNGLLHNLNLGSKG